jgi:hypothetical protein
MEAVLEFGFNAGKGGADRSSTGFGPAKKKGWQKKSG